MAKGGCDLIVLEMLINIDRLIACIDGAQGSGLPVWVGLSLAPIDGEMCLLEGESLIDTLAAIKDKNIALINIMHTEVGYIDSCLDVLEAHWDGAVGIYAHVCAFTENGEAIFDDTISPMDYQINYINSGSSACGVAFPGFGNSSGRSVCAHRWRDWWRDWWRDR